MGEEIIFPARRIVHLYILVTECPALDLFAYTSSLAMDVSIRQPVQPAVGSRVPRLVAHSARKSRGSDQDMRRIPYGFPRASFDPPTMKRSTVHQHVLHQ